jgi:hypothetical protein
MGKKAANPHLLHAKTHPVSKKKPERERKEHGGESDDADGVEVTPPLPKKKNQQPWSRAQQAKQIKPAWSAGLLILLELMGLP